MAATRPRGGGFSIATQLRNNYGIIHWYGIRKFGIILIMRIILIRRIQMRIVRRRIIIIIIIIIR